MSWVFSVCLPFQFSHSVVSDSLQTHEPQHARPACPSPTPWVYPNSCPLSQWCHPTISSSVILFSSSLQSFPASGSFLMSQFFPSGGQSTGAPASASVLPMNIQDWFTLGLAGFISLLSKWLNFLVVSIWALLQNSVTVRKKKPINTPVTKLSNVLKYLEWELYTYWKIHWEIWARRRILIP